ncbi:hypothetical protein DsansV1_C04g0042811 [Dioscorea sansibarensis]
MEDKISLQGLRMRPRRYWFSICVHLRAWFQVSVLCLASLFPLIFIEAKRRS